MLRRILLFTAFTLALHPLAGWPCVENFHLKGNLIQGGLVQGKIEPGSAVFLQQTSVAVFQDGRFILGFDRDAPAQIELTLMAPDQSKCIYPLQITKREYQIQKIDGLPHKKVNPDAESLIRIRNESAAIREARSTVDMRIDFASGFIWPIMGSITGVYGSQRILNGEPRRPHYGVDVAAPVGAAVRAPAAGRVTYSNSDMYFSGGTIVLDHGLGLSSSFLHLSAVLVSVGQDVKQGELIGKVGATGRVTGPHLDWRMNWQDAYIDPELLVDPMPASK